MRLPRSFIPIACLALFLLGSTTIFSQKDTATKHVFQDIFGRDPGILKAPILEQEILDRRILGRWVSYKIECEDPELKDLREESDLLGALEFFEDHTVKFDNRPKGHTYLWSFSENQDTVFIYTNIWEDQDERIGSGRQELPICKLTKNKLIVCYEEYSWAIGMVEIRTFFKRH